LEGFHVETRGFIYNKYVSGNFSLLAEFCKAEQSEQEKQIHEAALDKMRELQQREYNSLCE